MYQVTRGNTVMVVEKVRCAAATSLSGRGVCRLQADSHDVEAIATIYHTT
jgi:hypothetical protein